MFYFKHKDRQMSIDATEERREFGPARLINHSRKNPNLRPKVITAYESILVVSAIPTSLLSLCGCKGSSKCEISV